MSDATRADTRTHAKQGFSRRHVHCSCVGMRNALTLVLLASLLLAPTRARACWDGFAASLGHVSVLVASDEAVWNSTEVEETALWLGRVNALLPDNGSLELEHGYGVLDCGQGPAEFEWRGGWPQLFQQVARQCHATSRARAEAMSAVTPVYTVQLAATHDEANAERLAEAVNTRELDASGFIEVGGFPAMNPVAHVVTEGALHRVWVGAFLDRAEAEAVATLLGEGAYVRSLARVQ